MSRLICVVSFTTWYTRLHMFWIAGALCFCFQFDWIKPDVICTMYSESNMMNGIGQRNMQSFHFKYAYRDVLLTLMGVNSRRILGRKLFFLDIIELCILLVMIISTTHSKINNLLNLPYLTFLHSWLICGTIDCIIQDIEKWSLSD